MCSTQVKLTEYPPFCICALRDPYLLPSKETPACRKQSSFNYLSPEQSPCDVIIPWQLSVQPHWPVSVAPSMVPTQCILIEWTSGMWKGKFFAIQHYKGIVSPFHHDTTDSTALEKKKIWYHPPPGNIANPTGNLRSVSMKCSHDTAGKGGDWRLSSGRCLTVFIRLRLSNKIQSHSRSLKG